MSDKRSVVNQSRKNVQELSNFDWHQLLRPARVGRWPMLVRLLLLLVCALLIVSLIFTTSNLLAPEVREEEYGLVTTLEEKISAQQERNVFLGAQKLELKRRGFYSYALLQQDSVEVADITQTMDIVRAAADASGLQLLSVAPELQADKDLAIMRVKAELTLLSLSLFWGMLSDAPVHFSVRAIELEHTDKPDIFELNLAMIVQVNADVQPPTLRLAMTAARETSALAASDDPDALNRANQKGFLTRSGSAQFLYLIKDEKGRLTRVEN